MGPAVIRRGTRRHSVQSRRHPASNPSSSGKQPVVIWQATRRHPVETRHHPNRDVVIRFRYVVIQR
jgi:hypothetical protein